MFGPKDEAYDQYMADLRDDLAVEKKKNAALTKRIKELEEENERLRKRGSRFQSYPYK